jgi:DNA polymerase-3 subunit delta
MSNTEVARRIGVSPYFAKEYVFAARRFSQGAIERAFTALLAADHELKGGSRRTPQLIITLLLRQLMPPSARSAAA